MTTELLLPPKAALVIPHRDAYGNTEYKPARVRPRWTKAEMQPVRRIACDRCDKTTGTLTKVEGIPRQLQQRYQHQGRCPR